MRTATLSDVRCLALSSACTPDIMGRKAREACLSSPLMPRPRTQQYCRQLHRVTAVQSRSMLGKGVRDAFIHRNHCCSTTSAKPSKEAHFTLDVSVPSRPRIRVSETSFLHRRHVHDSTSNNKVKHAGCYRTSRPRGASVLSTDCTKHLE